MEISKRLKTVAGEVRYRTVVDIGTDHGYVPIYLVKNKLADSAIACDINKGPLLKAKQNIEANCLLGKIETRLGSGLIPIEIGEVETAVIAGMGGMLTIEILKAGGDVVQSLKQLVLQPQLDIDSVRKYIHTIGFKIENEQMLIDDGKYYTVINAVHGEEKTYDQCQYMFGKVNLDKKSDVLKKYLMHRLGKLTEIKDGLEKSGTENSMKKLNEIENEIRVFEEALKAYEM
ncbi:MAG: tRNA (adenine(22)-N(1))-methyltransferase TrmK [Anaerotignaceae bacterium]